MKIMKTERIFMLRHCLRIRDQSPIKLNKSHFRAKLPLFFFFFILYINAMQSNISGIFSENKLRWNYYIDEEYSMHLCSKSEVILRALVFFKSRLIFLDIQDAYNSWQSGLVIVKFRIMQNMSEYSAVCLTGTCICI